MKKLNTHQAGFGAAEIIIICLVAVVIGGTGFLVFKKSSSTKNATTSTSTTTDTPAKHSLDTTAQPAQPAIQYLEIKEWGVQLPLSDSIKDAYYVPSTGSIGFDGVINHIHLGLKSLDNDNCKATGTVNADGNITWIAAISRAKPTEVDPVHGKPYPELHPDGVLLDGDFYMYGFWRDSICDAPKTTLQAVDSAFAESAKGMVSAGN